MRPVHILLLLPLLLFFSCTKETEEFISEPVTDYLPLQVGKYITYRTDSTVFVNFGRNMEVRSYQEKHIVDAQVTDAMGRTSYMILTQIRDFAGTQPWRSSSTYLITTINNSAEVIENNLRFLKLVLPIKQDMSWKSNRFLPSSPYEGIFTFSNDDNMADWESAYTTVGETAAYNNKSFSNVLTVQSIDESVNAPVTSPQQYGYKNYLREQYAKGVGLIFQEYIMWEYQPNPSGPSGYQTGFGVKRTILDHN